jgi:hypothetical protein
MLWKDGETRPVASPAHQGYFGLVEAGLVLGVDCEFGVVPVPFGVVVAPVEVDPGVIVPLLLLVPVVELPVFEDCGTAEPLAGTQSALAVLVVPGVEVVLVEVEPVEALVLGVLLEVELGEVLALELGIELLELLGEVLLLELGDVVLVDVLGVVLVELVVPVALALVRGTIPAGQLLVEEALGVVELGLVAEVPLCDDDGIVEGEVLAPDCVDEGEVVVVDVVDVVCAATHVPAVRITTKVNFFMFSVLVISSGSICDARIQGRVRCRGPKNKGQHLPALIYVTVLKLLAFKTTCGPCDGTMHPSPMSPSRVASAKVVRTQSAEVSRR